MRSTLIRGAALVAALALVTAVPALAGGFQVQQQGAKAAGRGGAFVAQADDASATYYNPAAAGHLDGWNFYLGGSLLEANTSFDAAAGGSEDMQDSPLYPTQIYLTGPIGDHYAFALGAFTPYALRTHWYAGGPVDRSALKTVWDSLELNLSIVGKVTDKVSVAVGYENVRFVVNDMSQSYNTDLIAPYLFPGPPATDPQQNITLAGNKGGFNVAIHYKGDNGRRFGLSFRSPKIIRADGQLRWSEVEEGPFFSSGQLANDAGCLPDPNQPGETYCPLGAAFTDSKATSTFALPMTVQLGFGREGQGKWDWEGDIIWSSWDTFDSIDIDVESPNSLSTGISSKPTTAPVHQKENWRSTISLHGGADYHFNDRHTARFGITYDPSPVKEDYARPYNIDADKIGLTGGYGWRGLDGKVAADLYGQLWFYGDREPSGGPTNVVPGSYDTTAFAIGGSVQFHF